MTGFEFVDDTVLRSNIEVAFEHILELTTISESKNFGKTIAVSSFSKTIIIHIGAIVEALMHWKLKKRCSTDKLELINEWVYPDLKILFEINESEQIIAGKRKSEKRDVDRLEFLQIIRLCEKHSIIKSKTLLRDVDKIREYRNKQHIGGLAGIERKYSRRTLNFCFNTVVRVVKEVSS